MHNRRNFKDYFPTFGWLKEDFIKFALAGYLISVEGDDEGKQGY